MNKKPIIAVDARPLSSSITGISRAISKIIENIDKEFNFYLFSHLPYHKDFEYLIMKKNVIWNTIPNPYINKGGIWYIYDFPRIINKLMPDIFWGTQQTIPPFLNKKIKKIITVNDFVSIFHPNSMNKLSYIQQRILLKYSLYNSNLIITISFQTLNDLKKLYPGINTNAMTIYFGFDMPEKNKSIQKIPIFNQKYILAVSTIEPRKNYSTLLEAYYKYYLSETEKPYSLVIAGKRGWESEKFYRRLEELQEKTNTIYVLDYVNDEVLFELYKNAAFFCMPSIYEGFGFPVLEALCFQKNVILSDISCFHEIADGYGKFLPPKEIDLWAYTIREYVELHKKNQLPKMNYPCSKWSWKNTAKNYIEVFNSLISS